MKAERKAALGAIRKAIIAIGRVMNVSNAEFMRFRKVEESLVKAYLRMKRTVEKTTKKCR